MVRKRKKSGKPPRDKSKELQELENLLDQLDWGQESMEDLASLDVVLDPAMAIFLAYFDLEKLGEEAQQALEELEEAIRLANYDPMMCELKQANTNRGIVTNAMRKVALDESTS